MDKLLLPEPFLTGKPLEAWLASMCVTDWSINGGLVDVHGDVNIQLKLGKLKRLPVRFGKVSGDFICDHNQLVSLEGTPKVVGGGFVCTHNQLAGLEGAPKEVGRSFWCSSNQLASLKGGPQEVGGYFNCGGNQLVSLKGAPSVVAGNFYCSSNQLESLEGAPEKVGGHFWCHHNLLVDFKGLEVTSIVGTLHVTSSGISGQDNVFVSLEGLPKDLYSKVVGLDIPVMLELERKRATSLLGAKVAEVISEVELG